MQKPTPSSDAELLTAIAGGHGDSFAVFYRRHLPTVIAFLMGRVGDREAAADLSAEVFASVLTSAQRYRPDSDTAVPWLISIAHHKLVSSVRRRVVESKARRRLGYEPVELDDQDLSRVDDMAAIGRDRINDLVESLPENQRVALLAHVVEDKSYAEVAARLQTSEMVIRKRVSRGLQRLRTELGEEYS